MAQAQGHGEMDMAQHGAKLAWHRAGTARHGTEWHGRELARHGMAWSWHGTELAWHGLARHGAELSFFPFRKLLSL